MRYLNFATGTNGSTSDQVERLVIAIDVSYSMDEDDWKPTRLAAAKEATAALIERKRCVAPEDEIAIVSYAGSAKILCRAVTAQSDTPRLFQALGNIELDGYTNITAGLHASQRALKLSKRRTFVERLLWDPAGVTTGRCDRIVLLTDGGHNEGRSPRSLASKLKNAGVCIDCIGIGGSPADVDEDLLKEIATLQPDGVTPRYAFIGDKSDLIAKFEQLAGRITR